MASKLRSLFWLGEAPEKPGAQPPPYTHLADLYADRSRDGEPKEGPGMKYRFEVSLDGSTYTGPEEGISEEKMATLRDGLHVVLTDETPYIDITLHDGSLLVLGPDQLRRCVLVLRKVEETAG